jgi:dTDP-3-amino-3,4,6-trideoxy-alpha-D-glucose transaminase
MSSPSAAVRIGVIGFGQWGPNHVRNFNMIDGAEVVRGCDASPARSQAAILHVKLSHLARWNDQRRQVAAWYRENLRDCAAVVLPQEMPWCGRHVYHLFVVRFPGHDRDLVARKLLERGVQTVVHYPIPIHRQKAYAELGYPAGAFPNAERAAVQ